MESVSRSATGFALDLYRQFSEKEQNQGKNLFFSPYGIYTVLALMYGGAAGETAQQMAAAEPSGSCDPPTLSYVSTLA